MLGHVEFAINSTQADGTGMSPAELVYGEPLRSPLDVVVGVQGAVGAGDAGEFASRVSKLVSDAK